MTTNQVLPQIYKEPTHRKLYRHIIYLVPTCSNPSGKTTTLARRKALVQLARKYNCLVICDDVYDFLQWALSDEWQSIPRQVRLPRLCDIDLALGPAEDDPGHFGYAISNGTFSKIVGPGVRTGWVEASPAFAYGLSQTGSTRSGGAPSQFSAALMCEMLKSGDISRQIDTLTRAALQRRHRLMLDAIQKHLGTFNVAIQETSLLGSNIFGGYFVWFRLPEGSPTAKAIFSKASEEENLIIGHGDIFEVHGDEASARFRHDIRLCFSWEPEDSLIEGVERLGRVLAGMMGGTPSNSGSPTVETPNSSLSEFK